MRISDWSSDVCSSDLPEAALYWLLRMLDGGCDPIYLARRLTRMAVEDIGLADPRALEMAIAAWDAFDRIGSPEGELALAQVTLYLACNAKSNAGYVDFNAARPAVRAEGTAAVPPPLRNAPTKLKNSLAHRQGTQYVTDLPDRGALDKTRN